MCKFKLTTDALPTIYQPGEKVAQLIIMPYPTIEPTLAEELAESDRGENGFGSSDNTAENETQESGRDSGAAEGDNK
nr:MAG: dUTPase [Bacteriophage sp.]